MNKRFLEYKVYWQKPITQQNIYWNRKKGEEEEKKEEKKEGEEKGKAKFSGIRKILQKDVDLIMILDLS